jgi:hypothetical protein
MPFASEVFRIVCLAGVVAFIAWLPHVWSQDKISFFSLCLSAAAALRLCTRSY